MSTPATLPSFDRAEYHGDPPAPDQCAFCERHLVGEYFRVGGSLACASCAQQAQSVILPDSHKAYSRALLFGAGAAFAAFVGYTLMSMTGFMIGYVAIAVGWLVGKAMKKGSNGRGGRRYQVTAALLTYAAISFSFVPLAIREYSQQPHPTATVEQKQDAQTSSTASPSNSASAKPAHFGEAISGLLKAFGILLLLGIISPFLAFTASVGHGLFTVFFLFIGIQTAIRLTRKEHVEVEGPYTSVVA